MLVWQFARGSLSSGVAELAIGELLPDRLFPRVVIDRLVPFFRPARAANRC